MDVKAIGDAIGNGISGFTALLASGSWIVIATLLLSSAWLLRSSTGKRLTKGLEETMFSNWRLALLGATGIVLSLASGWTTWDGMRNFTNEPLLSMMITFGIQGVMLIVAWLIGESFATGMSQGGAASKAGGIGRSAQAIGGAVFGTMLFIAAIALLFQTTGHADVRQIGATDIAMSKWADRLLIMVVGVSLVALFVLYSAGDLIKPYVQSSRIIIKNAVLWVMFLACMATSVFFSFDSLFTAIFPQSERVRAAELRAQNQVAGIIADIGTTIQTKQAQESEELFRSDGWKVYDRNLGDLARSSQGAERDIEAYFVQQMEARRSGIAQQQERIVSAQSSQAGLNSKKTTLTEEASRLKGERPSIAADLTEKKTELDNRSKSIDEKRVEAMAEDKGVEGTGKAGRGPVYRQRMDELAKMQDYVKIQDDRVRDAQKRLSTVDSRIAQIERELAQTDGDIAKLTGEAQTAEQRIKVAQDSRTGEDLPKVDPARVRLGFETSRTDFRQEPTGERLTRLQQLCTQLHGALSSAPATKDRVRGIDCDPKTAVEAAARLFALHDGQEAFAKQCAGGDKLNQLATADSLFGFARKCLADSGLPSKETDQLRTRINFIELNRDDKAHRFVVTWNAFQDGNRLAYLALAIAIAIDSLVFMSGLFGANAVRSPLSDVPSLKARSAQQLEAFIRSALGDEHERYDNAKLLLQNLRPSADPEYSLTIRLSDLNAIDAERIIPILNAGREIGAVAVQDQADELYLVRGELAQFLATFTEKEVARDADGPKRLSHKSTLSELDKTLRVALLPDVGANAELVLGFMHPIREDRGFMAEIRLQDVEWHDKQQGRHDLRIVRNALNAGATFDRIQRVGDNAAHYYVHGDFYKTLVRIRARLLSTTSQLPTIAGPGSGGGPLHGGSIRDRIARLGSEPPTVQIEDRRPARKSGPALKLGVPGQMPWGPVTAAIAADAEEKARDAEQAYLTYWSELVSALGVNPQLALQRLGKAEASENAMAAWSQLTDLAQKNQTLNDLIEEHKASQEELLRNTYAHLRDHAIGDQALLDALDAADDNVERRLPIFMLFPENGLLDYLIISIERAASFDDGLQADEQKLLDGLRRVRTVLREADLSDPQTWRRIGSALQTVAAEQYAQHGRRAPGTGGKRIIN